MTTILNLSSLLAMPRGYKAYITTVIDAFALELRDSPPSTMLCGVAFFSNEYATRALVLTKYLMYKSTVIDPYKLGKLTTEEFLAESGKIFPSLSQEAFIRAWNSSLDLDEKCISRINQVFADASKEKPLYLISNSNELNIRSVLDKMSAKGVALFDTIDISCEASTEGVEIAPNVYLCLSYRYGLSKVRGQLEETSHTTQSLIKHVATQNAERTTHGDMMRLRVISQHPADRLAAEKLGVPKAQVLTDSAHFQDEELLQSTPVLS